MSSKNPDLGAFSAPVTVPVTVGGVAYEWKSMAATFTPSGSEKVRSISGVGSFLPVGVPLPVPVPVPPPVPVPTPTPTPNPGPLLNVRDYGARGDGSTDDRAAIRKAIAAANPKQTVFFPAGRYLIRDTVKLYNKSDVTFEGEGETSEILHPQGNGLVLSDGNALTALAVYKLAFRGSGDGIFLYGTRGANIQQCLFTGCGHAVYDAGPGSSISHGATKGTVIRNCTVMGWGSVALFLNGDNLVEKCSLIQTAPKGTGSHGIYIHAGASNCTVQDTLIKNSSKYGVQVYGEEEGTVTRNTTLRRLTIDGCGQGGIILAHSEMGAADVEGCVIEECKVMNVAGGHGIHVKNGTGVTVRGNQISGVAGAGVLLGYWAPYESSMSMGPVLVERNVVHGCRQGLWAMESNGGKFISVLVKDNDFSGNQAFDIHLEEWNGVKPHLTLSGNLGRVAGSGG